MHVQCTTQSQNPKGIYLKENLPLITSVEIQLRVRALKQKKITTKLIFIFVLSFTWNVLATIKKKKQQSNYLTFEGIKIPSLRGSVEICSTANLGIFIVQLLFLSLCVWRTFWLTTVRANVHKIRSVRRTNMRTGAYKNIITYWTDTYVPMKRGFKLYSLYSPLISKFKLVLLNI